MDYDYVILGGGSAGAVLAGRLSEDPAVSVCLIEAGGEGKNALIRMPLGCVALLPGKPKINNWAFETVPQPGLNGRQGYQPRGKAQGGSSPINAMLNVCRHRQVYDEWADLGCDGWNWAQVAPYFLKAEHNHAITDDHSRKWHMYKGYRAHVCVLRLESRGKVGLNDAHPMSAPISALIIDPRFLSEQADADLLLQGTKIMRDMMSHPALYEWRGEQLYLNGDEDDATLMHHIRDRADTIKHSVGAIIRSGRAVRARRGTIWRWSIRLAACMGSKACVSSMPLSCRALSAATPTLRPS